MPPRSPSVRKSVARPRLVPSGLQPDASAAATRAFDNARARLRRSEPIPTQSHPLLPQGPADKLDQILDGIRELLQRQAADERRLTKIEQRLEAIDPTEDVSAADAPATDDAPPAEGTAPTEDAQETVASVPGEASDSAPAPEPAPEPEPPSAA